MSTDSKTRILVITNVISALISIVAITISTYLYTTQLKIAYVDNTRVLTEYNGIKEGQQLYEEKANQWKANLDTLEVEVNRAIKEYQNDFAGMTPKEKELTEIIIEKKQESYFQYKKALEKKASEEDGKLTQVILNRIDSYLLDFGNTHEYDIIIGITTGGNLLYGRVEADITDQIITGLNNNYEGN